MAILKKGSSTWTRPWCSVYSLAQGSPNPRPRTGIGRQPVRNRAAQQEVSGRQASEASSAVPHRPHYHLNYPPTTVEKLSSTKPVPGAKKVGDHCSSTLTIEKASILNCRVSPRMGAACRDTQERHEGKDCRGFDLSFPISPFVLRCQKESASC